MNDPHVEALFYRVKHAGSVDYDKAPPLEHQEPGFAARLADNEARIDMIDHYATAEAARAAVEPFLRAWELSAALRQAPGEFEIIYKSADVIDRHPTPGRVHVPGVAVVAVAGSISTHVGRAKYPPPPEGLARDAVVDLMLARYALYRSGSTTLADAANYCLTALEGVAGGRAAAAGRYVIDKTVLGKIGELGATKGGTFARKARGAGTDFTPAERRWLEQCMPLLIRRAAEVVFDPGKARPQLTMADLPPLP